MVPQGYAVGNLMIRRLEVKRVRTVSSSFLT